MRSKSLYQRMMSRNENKKVKIHILKPTDQTSNTIDNHTIDNLTDNKLLIHTNSYPQHLPSNLYRSRSSPQHAHNILAA